jgi:hypothetical protein
MKLQLPAPPQGRRGLLLKLLREVNALLRFTLVEAPEESAKLMHFMPQN